MNYLVIHKNLSSPFNYITIATYISFLFYLSFYSTSEYFMITLSKIIEELSITSDLAAIVLLNIGNGIPDLISNFIVMNENAFHVVLSSLGSMVFMLTFALAMVIFFSNKTNFVHYGNFYKNIFSILGTFGFYMYILAAESISFFLSITMLVSYLMFIVYSFYFSKMHVDSAEIPTRSSSTTKTLYSTLFKLINLPLKILLDFCLINHDTKEKAFPRWFYGLMSPIINFAISNLFLDIKIKYKEAYLIMLVCLLIGIVLATLIAYQKMKLVVYLYSFLASCLLMQIFQSEIVGLLYFLNEDKIIPKELSLLVLLPIGNCIGDLITGVVASKSGLFKTAAYSCVTAPIHNTLLNLGIVFLVMLIRNDMDAIDAIYDTIINPAIALVPLICINLVLNYEIRNRKLCAELGVVLVFMYTAFVYFSYLQLNEY